MVPPELLGVAPIPFRVRPARLHRRRTTPGRFVPFAVVALMLVAIGAEAAAPAPDTTSPQSDSNDPASKPDHAATVEKLFTSGGDIALALTTPLVAGRPGAWYFGVLAGARFGAMLEPLAKSGGAQSDPMVSVDLAGEVQIAVLEPRGRRW